MPIAGSHWGEQRRGWAAWHWVSCSLPSGSNHYNDDDNDDDDDDGDNDDGDNNDGNGIVDYRIDCEGDGDCEEGTGGSHQGSHAPWIESGHIHDEVLAS